MRKNSTIIGLMAVMLLAQLAARAQKNSYDSSFVTIYKKILVPACGIPACHDGTFEPDFRTVQSSYNTLVYHPVFKNNNQGTFKYRVTPYDAKSSVFHERITNCCFVNDNDRMPFTVGITLKPDEIEMIKDWINKGAKDIHGNTPKQVNTAPIIDMAFAAYTIDSLFLHREQFRQDNMIHKPVKIPGGLKSAIFSFSLRDDNSLQSKELKAELRLCTDSTYKDIAKVYSLKLENNLWLADVKFSNLPKESVLFMQVNVINSKTGNKSEFPNLNVSNAVKHIWSFIVPG